MGKHIWWLLLLSGILAVIIGMLLLISPDKSIEVLIMFVGTFALLTGLLSIIHAYTARYPLWRPSLGGGLLTLTLGLIALFWPGLTATILVYTIAFWALFFGTIEMLGGLTIGAGSRAGALGTGVGLVSVVLAILLFIVPQAAVVISAWLIGTYFLLSGGLKIYHAVEVRRATRRVSFA